MQFLLDHNVLGSISGLLVERGHNVVWSRDACGQDAADPVIAALAMEEGRVLVSHDNDMKRVQRFVSSAHRERFPTLSRLMLQCDQATSLVRLRQFMPLVEFEFEQSQMAGQQFMFHIQQVRAVVCR